ATGAWAAEPMPGRGAPARRSDQDGLAPIPKGAEPVLIGGVVPDVDRKPGGAKALEQPQSPRTLVRRRGLELHHAGAMKECDLAASRGLPAQILEPADRPQLPFAVAATRVQRHRR